MSPKCKTLSSSEEFPDYGGTIKFANHLIHKGVMVSAIPNSREGGVLFVLTPFFNISIFMDSSSAMPTW